MQMQSPENVASLAVPMQKTIGHTKGRSGRTNENNVKGPIGKKNEKKVKIQIGKLQANPLSLNSC